MAFDPEQLVRARDYAALIDGATVGLYEAKDTMFLRAEAI